ncbi:YeiH family protein [Streptomyces yaizuensis]|uniref:Sulfate exporter family transporter n=1 Tax=Streptomyces yaizuensis TaxID=2989713 RepID=A0ABQ5NSA2_9ACTN|nr:putative sulfate exporter family transporter [Streptomyces sp. YSPA8]GLF93225.1 putative sulfate exporter family transporter [Streptomyces sp. YSPA8]
MALTGTRTAPAGHRRGRLLPVLPPAVPGLALAATGTVAAWLVHRAVPAVPLLTAAVLLGLAAAHVPRLRTRITGRYRPGLAVASRRLMRVGIVLLGLKVGVGDLLGLGWATVVMVAGVVAATLLGTWWLGRRLGLPGDQPLLIATGYAICGASAIGAVSAVRDSDEEDIAPSIALVTLCGTLAIVVLPLLHHPLGLSAGEFGRWVGASVHDVGQVVAAAGTAGGTALTDAVVVKLLRVMTLAPLVAVLALAARRRIAAEAGPGDGSRAARPPLVPLFVAGFLAMVALRSTGAVPAEALGMAATAQEILLAAALFALGTAVHLPSLSRTGMRVAGLGLAAWVLIAAVSYAGVLLTA